MASDWIRIRTDIYRDPKVIRITDSLMDSRSAISRYVNQICQCDMSVTRNVMRNATVGALVTIWGTVRRQGKRSGDDLLLRDALLETLDDIGDMPGIGQAMAESGWVSESEESLVFPRFFSEYNSEVESDLKAKNAERQRRYRDTKRNVTRDVTVALQSNTEEKRQEEKRVNKEEQAVACGPPAWQFEIVDSFNATFGLESRLTKKRQTALAARWKDEWWRDNWKSAIDRGGGSAFLRGANDRGWMIDLEFFLKPDTVAKILEGKYDNRPGTTKQTSGATREQQTASSFDSLRRARERAGVLLPSGHVDGRSVAGNLTGPTVLDEAGA